ncbi:hypothetical protein RRG08_027874 [Elysia crispata]|uniref:Uncharacterized protein n=1 Tax=Elysia crispata TaxID=231223 RepID=A0AAE1DTC3_9GAST|nr:hypothetical protein RRG08_027874 [Elysia crispata]
MRGKEGKGRGKRRVPHRPDSMSCAVFKCTYENPVFTWGPGDSRADFPSWLRRLRLASRALKTRLIAGPGPDSSAPVDSPKYPTALFAETNPGLSTLDCGLAKSTVPREVETRRGCGFRLHQCIFPKQQVLVFFTGISENVALNGICTQMVISGKYNFKRFSVTLERLRGAKISLDTGDRWTESRLTTLRSLALLQRWGDRAPALRGSGPGLVETIGYSTGKSGVRVPARTGKLTISKMDRFNTSKGLRV